MSAYEWFRIRRTMLAYDYWLDVEGVTGRARKDLRGTRRNLMDATAAVGYPAARRSLGSRSAPSPLPQRRTGTAWPRWVVGSYAAIVVFAIGRLCHARPDHGVG